MSAHGTRSDSESLSILSWNVNSVRLRLTQVRRLAARYHPDVICLQETKVRDELFPWESFRELGFSHVLAWGQKTHHGVAILARTPLLRQRRKIWAGRPECRHVYATIDTGIEIHNLYVPAGGDIPDPRRNPRFAYKLLFLEELCHWFRRRRRKGNCWILLGDLNVAPLPTDVWSHQRLRRVVTHTEAEVQALEELRCSHDWIDVVRHFVPENRKVFTWWSYRAGDWRKANKGRRLDHVWATPALGPRLLELRVLGYVRGWWPPSDHVPILLRLEKTPRSPAS